MLTEPNILFAKTCFRRFLFMPAVGAAAFLAAFGVVGQVGAQQTVVPLDRFDDRVGITVGVNGGAAKEYLFDTGSDLFNIAIGNGPSPAWFPNYSGPKNQNSLATYMYGDGTYGYLYGPTTVSTIQFYASSQSQAPVNNGSFGPYAGGTLPVGAVVYDIATAASLQERGLQQGVVITNPGVTPNTFYQNLTWQNKLSAGTAPEEGKLYGTFGAGDWGASILGRLTSTGYVVEANGTDTTPGGCGVACLVIGLTPELRAQFFSVVSWSSTKSPFPMSGAPASDHYGVMFNYVLGSGTNTSSSKLATLLDTGYPGNELRSTAVFNAQSGFGNLTTITGTGGNYVVAGLTFNMSGDSSSAQTVAATTSGVSLKNGEVVSPDFLNTVQVKNDAANEAIAGLSFYTTNAVMYDLQNTAIGYTPFYVTVASFTNGLTVSRDMGPLGVAGVISGQNGVAINPNGIAYLTAANTYTGATMVAQAGWLGVGGPGSIAASSNVAVDGTLDLFHSSKCPKCNETMGQTDLSSPVRAARCYEYCLRKCEECGIGASNVEGPNFVTFIYRDALGGGIRATRALAPEPRRRAGGSAADRIELFHVRHVREPEVQSGRRTAAAGRPRRPTGAPGPTG
jgi:subtilase-type serine protease